MVWKRILAAITVILVVLAIVLIKKKAKQMPIKKATQEVRE